MAHFKARHFGARHFGAITFQMAPVVVPPPPAFVAVTAKIVASIATEVTKPLDLSTGMTANLSIPFQADLPSGTAAGEVGTVWGDTRTLGPSATEDLDLFGTLIDAFQNVVNPTSLSAVLILADALNTNDVIVGGAPSAAFVGPFGAAADTHKVRRGGLYLWYAPAGFPLASGADLLKVANGGAGTSVTYSIVVVGR